MSKAKTAEIVYPRATEQDAEAIDAFLDGGKFPSRVAPSFARLLRKARKEGRKKGRAEALTEWLKEAFKEGLKEGFKEGLGKGEAVTVAYMIFLRYAECDQEILTQVLASVDKEFLECVGKALLTTDTYEDFLQKAQL